MFRKCHLANQYSIWERILSSTGTNQIIFTHSHLEAARYDLPGLVCSHRAAGCQVAYSPISYPCACYWMELQARYLKTDTWQHVQQGRKNNNYKKGKIVTHTGSLQIPSHISDGSHRASVTLCNSCPPLTLCQVSPAGQFFHFLNIYSVISHKIECRHLRSPEMHPPGLFL